MEDRKDWLRWRKNGIGGSDAPALWEASPYLTFRDLIIDKLDPSVEEKESNFITSRGNDLEIKARYKLSTMYNLHYSADEDFAPKKIQSEALPFMLATLDGSTKDGRVIAEFKFMSEPPTEGKPLTPGQLKHSLVNRTDIPISDPLKECRVPFNYWIQIQHQLAVSGAEYCIFGSFDSVTLNTCKVLPDLKFIEQHIDKCAKAWQLVLAKKIPEPSNEDYKELRVKGAKTKTQEWKQLKRLLEETTERLETIRDELLAMCDHPLMTCDGVRFTQSEGRQGSIDYPRILNLPEVIKLGIDPEKFRKAQGKPYWTVSAIKVKDA
jgi:hypothetical protein